MYKSLYRKYRPTTFEEVCGRDEIIAILKNQIKRGKFAHAYLFCGTRGTGKTTCAKILARAVNCLEPVDGNPCGKCSACLAMQSGLNTDIVEMDAASNNGVGDVRELIEELIYTPTELKKRVYIIDEVHMMSQSAFNALLKTLEEPPEHVIFILATTELNKLPATIISRCQRYDFDRLPNSVICKRLRYVAQCENIDIDDEALFVIAKLAQGGMRDALVYLELCMGNEEKITAEKAAHLFGVTSFEQLASLSQAITENDMGKVFTQIGDIYNGSRELNVFWADLIGFYRDMLVCKTVEKYTDYIECSQQQASLLKNTALKFTKEKLISHLKVMNDALYLMQKNPSMKRTSAELALIKMCDPLLDSSNEALNDRVSQLEDKYAAIKLGRVSQSFLPEQDKEEITAPNGEKIEIEPKESEDSKKTPDNTDGGTVKELKNVKRWIDIAAKMMSVNPASRMFLTDSTAYEGNGCFYIFVSSPISFDLAQKSRESIIDTVFKATDGKYDGKNVVITQKSSEDNEKYKFIDELE